MSTKILDTITFSLTEERVIVNKTVKLTASISCIVAPDQTEESLKEGIKKMMQSFISETNINDVKSPVSWQFSSITRSNHPSGMEQVTLIATSRVHESDNRALEKRRRDVSREGMSITNIAVDSSPPISMIEKTHQELRLAIIKKAHAECAAINELGLSDDYGVHQISFDNLFNQSSSNNIYAMINNSPKGGSTYSLPTDDDSLGNAVKLNMMATITLAKTN